MRCQLRALATLDVKSRGELAVATKETAEIEQELFNLQHGMKEEGVEVVDNIWNNYCRIEAEFFTKMDDAYLEPSTPKPAPKAVSVTAKGGKVHGSSENFTPVIADSEEE